MKLLLDQNISYRIVKKITNLFPGSEQVKRLQLENRSDLEIWKFAREHNYSILTFDSDFLDLNTLYGTPPKIILLRTENQTSKNIEQIITQKSETIAEYLNDPENKGCLQIFN